MDNQFHLKTDYKTVMDKVILYFLAIPEAEVYLISHVLMKEYDDVENDFKVWAAHELVLGDEESLGGQHLNHQHRDDKGNSTATADISTWHNTGHFYLALTALLSESSSVNAY